jgi:hypothetical protein
VKKFKKHRASVEFEYEFEDGKVETFTYLSTTTNQIEKTFDIKEDDVKGQLDFSMNILKENIVGNRVDDLIAELKEGNIFDFKAELDAELGKQKKKR